MIVFSYEWRHLTSHSTRPRIARLSSARLGCLVSCVRGGSIPALDTLCLVNATNHASHAATEPAVMLESQPTPRCFLTCMARKVASLLLEQVLEGQEGQSKWFLRWAV